MPSALISFDQWARSLVTRFCRSCRRARDDLDAERRDLGRDFGVLRRLDDLFLELCDHLFRRRGRQEDRVPVAERVALHAGLGDRREVGKRLRAMAVGHRERAELALLDVGQDRRDRLDRDLHPSEDQVLHVLRAALVGHLDHLAAGGGRERLGRHLRHDVGLAVEELAGVRLDVVGEFLRGLRRHGRMHHERERVVDDERHRREVLGRVVGQLRVERRVHRERGADRVADGVAVRRALTPRPASR